MSNYSEEQWISWMDKLAEKDYVIIDDFITNNLYTQIKDYFAQLDEEDKLRKAGIGAIGEFKIEKEVRGDFIYWLDKERDKVMAPFFELIEEVTEKLKRYCFISLSGSEFHLAKYPAGSFYHRHLDQFKKRNNRQITILIYLNDAWKKGDGGELRIFREDEESVLVEPVARRLLMFKSDSVEHEVLTTNVNRYSLSGWLLHQPAALGQLFG